MSWFTGPTAIRYLDCAYNPVLGIPAPERLAPEAYPAAACWASSASQGPGIRPFSVVLWPCTLPHWARGNFV